MNKKCRALLKENNKRERGIKGKNQEIYTDMIVYLRGSDISEYNQELVREDLIQMIIDGQERGDDIQSVMGKEYKQVCDEIIDTMPKKTKAEKLMDLFTITLSSIWILGIIWIVNGIINNLKSDNTNWKFDLEVGDIISSLIIVVFANVFVIYFCKTAFDNTNKNKSKIKLFFRTWAIMFLTLGILVLSKLYFDYVLVSVSLLVAVAIIGIIFVVERITSRYI